MRPLHWAYWLCQLTGWGLYAALNSALAALTNGFTAPVVLSMISASAIGLGVSHALRWWVVRHDWTALDLPRLTTRVVLASAVLSLVTMVAQLTLVVFVFHAFDASEVRLGGFVFYFSQWAALFLLWQVLYFGVHALVRSRRAEHDRLLSEAATRTAELRALRSQVNPHFLFNSLNTVRALIAEDPPRAQEAVTRLSGLLRYALASADTHTVSLERELDMVNDYLALEVLRFEERLTVAVDVAPDCLSAQVPVMLLQTLVENAVKHGIARSTAGGEVRLTARKVDHHLLLSVSNPSPPVTAQRAESGGVGLANTRERLRLLFGARAGVELRQVGAQTIASVSLPCP